jgi:hypothetical protein
VCTGKSFTKTILLYESQKPNISHRMFVQKSMLKTMLSPESLFPSEGGEIFTNISQRWNIVCLSENACTASTIRSRDNRGELNICIFLKCFEEIGDTRSTSDKNDTHNMDIVGRNHIFQLLILQNKKEPIIKA